MTSLSKVSPLEAAVIGGEGVSNMRNPFITMAQRVGAVCNFCNPSKWDFLLQLATLKLRTINSDMRQISRTSFDFL